MTNTSPSLLFSNPLNRNVTVVDRSRRVPTHFTLVKETIATYLFKSHTEVTETAYLLASSNLLYTTIHATKKKLKYLCLLGFLTCNYYARHVSCFSLVAVKRKISNTWLLVRN